MSQALQRIDELRAEAEAAVRAALDTTALEALRVRFLGRKAELPNLLRGVAQLEPAERGRVGKAANEARQALERLITDRGAELEAGELQERLAADRVDVTLPGAPVRPIGRHHLLTQTRREIEDIFAGVGFRVVEGPEVETVFYNFDALNHDAAHPARSRSDTFYVAGRDAVVLRTHTSPMQTRSMELAPPPIQIIIPGRVYRRDSDATHVPQFHQVEGLAVDEGITMAHLKGTLDHFAARMFGEGISTRFRPSYFPFTEPSAEVDLVCFVCRGAGETDGAPCRTCRGEGWIEWGGCGVVNPRVLRACGVDAERYTGFAFGMGIDRTLMFRHRIEDMRELFEGDVRFTTAFGTEV